MLFAQEEKTQPEKHQEVMSLAYLLFDYFIIALCLPFLFAILILFNLYLQCCVFTHWKCGLLEHLELIFPIAGFVFLTFRAMH